MVTKQGNLHCDRGSFERGIRPSGCDYPENRPDIIDLKEEFYSRQQAGKLGAAKDFLNASSQEMREAVDFPEIFTHTSRNKGISTSLKTRSR